MRRLTDRLNLAKSVLHELQIQQLSRTSLEQNVIRKFNGVHATHATFEGIFRFLIQDEYIAKTAANHRALYAITEKGTKFLGALD
ncbi:MAG: hypothetical protein WC365_06585 [Candidatus Babeliales bacterium]|jgi:predicted transcriptional regulator